MHWIAYITFYLMGRIVGYYSHAYKQRNQENTWKGGAYYED